MSLADWASENSSTLAGLALAYVGYVEFTDATYPSVPSGTGVAVLAAAAVAVVGYFAAGKIYELLPDDEGIYLVAFKSSDEAGGEVWELSEDQFADLEVHGGTLFQWDLSSRRVYECREYRPQDNVAVANWRESVAASELAGDTLVTDAMEAIAELRQEFEPESRKFRLLQRRLRGVVRKLDRRRLQDQQAIMDQHTNPDFGDSNATVSDVINEELPDELVPDAMDFDGDETNGHAEEPEEVVEFDFLDEQANIDPINE